MSLEALWTAVSRSAFAVRSSSHGGLIVLVGAEPLPAKLFRGFTHVDAAATFQDIVHHVLDENHHGAVVIDGCRIAKINAMLPFDAGSKLWPEFGTRHMSAVELTKLSDALVVIISEERSVVSIAHRGALRPVECARDLSRIIRTFYAQRTLGRLSALCGLRKRRQDAVD